MAALTISALRARFAFEVRDAEQTLLADGCLSPLFVVTTASGEMHPTKGDFSSSEARHRSRQAVLLLAAASDAVMVMQRMETWMVADVAPEGVPSSQPEQRIEAVVVVLEGPVGDEVKRLASVREIVREDDGKPSSVRAIELPGVPRGREPESAGTMAELLGPQRRSAEERSLARALLDGLGFGAPGAA